MSTYHVSFFKNLLSSDGHPFKCHSGELTSVTRQALRKPQSLGQERSKPSTDVTGSSMRIRSRSMRDLINAQK
jgi:hypothetical protein